MKYKKRCQHCNKYFLPSNGTQKYCHECKKDPTFKTRHKQTIQDLLKIKQTIQKLEEERTQHRNKWKQHSLKVRQLSQELPTLYQQLLKTIPEK